MLKKHQLLQSESLEVGGKCAKFHTGSKQQ